jgi:two-component system nitrate/nitrite response regulator NarL
MEARAVSVRRLLDGRYSSPSGFHLNVERQRARLSTLLAGPRPAIHRPGLVLSERGYGDGAQQAKGGDSDQMTPVKARVRVLVVEDHPLFRKAVVDAIKTRADLEFVGESENGRDALEAIRATLPDVAVVDVQMPGIDGFGVLNAVTRDALPTRILLLTASVDSAAAFSAVGAGAAGCLLKNASGDTICDAIAAVARGETVLAAEVQSGIAGEIRMRSTADRPLLSPREHEILVLTAAGLSAPAVATRLVLSPATVRTHLQHLYDKLGVSDRAAAVAEAMRRGLLE